MNKKGSALIVVISLVAVLAIAGAAYLYGQNQSLKIKTSQTTSPVASSTSVPMVTPSSISLATATPAANKATVVFEAEGSFSQTEKDELKKKVINPFVDYYLTESDQVLLTLTVAKNLQASKDSYPYTAQAIFKGGGNMGFLVMKQGSGVDWWFPECMNGCNLSASYKAKYPEISAKVQ